MYARHMQKGPKPRDRRHGRLNRSHASESPRPRLRGSLLALQESRDRRLFRAFLGVATAVGVLFLATFVWQAIEYFNRVLWLLFFGCLLAFILAPIPRLLE